MDRKPDDRDRELLRVLQEDFPLSSRPFLDAAIRLGWDEQDVLSRLEKLTASGTVRKVGAVLSPKKMGYVSVLAAVDLPDEKVDEVSEIINSYSGVTHNYLREGHPNLWFTLTEPDGATLEKHLGEIEERTGYPIIKLPATKVFKIGVKLDI